MKYNDEKIAKSKSGMAVLIGSMLGYVMSIVLIIVGSMIIERGTVAVGVIGIIASVVLITILSIGLCGLKTLHPNEALVFVLFGNYYGTLKEAGFYWVNPFCVGVSPQSEEAQSSITPGGMMKTSVNLAGNTSALRKKISLKTSTLENQKQKVNDELGNPIEIGTIVIWQVKDPTKAVFNVDNYQTFISIQCDAVTRNTARCYPYDTNEAGDECSLRGSSQEIAELMKKELQEKVEIAGIDILDVRITHLAYAPEIASVMLQRQQAVAIIDARQKIVEGAVGMVEMALDKLSEKEVVELDEERKAAMVSNLLVVLCGNKDTQPIVNSGSIY